MCYLGPNRFICSWAFLCLNHRFFCSWAFLCLNHRFFCSCVGYHVYPPQCRDLGVVSTARPLKKAFKLTYSGLTTCEYQTDLRTTASTQRLNLTGFPKQVALAVRTVSMLLSTTKPPPTDTGLLSLEIRLSRVRCMNTLPPPLKTRLV